MSTRQHTYKHLDEDSKLSVKVDMRELVEMVDRMNYGSRRFLSHLVDVRRERLADDIKKYRNRGHDDIANSLELRGDQLANAIEAALNNGAY